MPWLQAPGLEHGRKQMVSYFLSFTVQLSSVPAKYKMKCRALHTWQAGVATVAVTASSGESRASKAQVHSDWRLKTEDGEGTGWNWQQEVILSFHPFNRQSRIVCKSDAERSSRNSVTAKKKKKYNKQPGELLSGQMDSRVTGHQISQTVPHKAAGRH